MISNIVNKKITLWDNGFIKSPYLKFFSLIIILLSFMEINASAGDFLISADSTVTIYRVQIASRSTDTAAAQIQQQLLNEGVLSVSVQSTGRGWRVYAGPWPTKSEATTTLNQVKSLGFPDALIVTTDISVDQAQAMNLPLQGSFYQQALSSVSPQINQSGYSIYSDALATWSLATDTIGWLNSIPYFAQVINNYSDASSDEDARLKLGRIYIKLYQKTSAQENRTRIQYAQAAIDALINYVNKYPQAPNAAIALKTVGDLEHSQSEYYSQRLQRTAVIYKKVIDTYSTNSIAPEAHLEYAGVLFELAGSHQYSWDSVREELSKVVNQYPTTVVRRAQSRAQAMIAETYLFENNYSKMILSAETALTMYPDVIADAALCHYLIGRANLELGNYTTAQTQFNTVMSDYSENSTRDTMLGLTKASALFGMARCYEMSGDTVLFQQTIQTLVKQYPNTSTVKAAHNLWDISTTVAQDTTLVQKLPDPFTVKELARLGGTHE